MATTIADLYWLSGESPKRDAAAAVNGSAPPAALAWSAVCCTLIYLIIIGRLCRPVLRRCDTLQRGAGGIIAACVGLVSAAVELDKSQEKPLKSLARRFADWAV